MNKWMFRRTIVYDINARVCPGTIKEEYLPYCFGEQMKYILV